MNMYNPHVYVLLRTSDDSLQADEQLSALEPQASPLFRSIEISGNHLFSGAVRF